MRRRASDIVPGWGKDDSGAGDSGRHAASEPASADDGAGSVRNQAFGQTIGPALHPVRGQQAETLSEDMLYAWLKCAMQVFQSAASSPDFLRTAAQAAAEMVDLDQVVVLLYKSGEWVTEVAHTRDGSPVSNGGPVRPCCSGIRRQMHVLSRSAQWSGSGAKLDWRPVMVAARFSMPPAM